MSDAPSYLFYQTRNPRPFLERGEGIYLFDESGRRYIDGSSGAMVSNIGHSNPQVLAKIKAQMDKATFGYRPHFRTHPCEDLAAKTVSLLPEGLDRVFFVSGGSEAVESAVTLARQYALTEGESARYKVISRFPSYHGSTFGALELTGYDPLCKPFKPMLRAMPKVACPATYLDRDTMEPLPTALNAYDRLVELAYARGLILYLRRTRGGTSGDHFLLAPPLIVTKEQIAQMMDILRDALSAFADEAGLSVVETAA